MKRKEGGRTILGLRGWLEDLVSVRKFFPSRKAVHDFLDYPLQTFFKVFKL